MPISYWINDLGSSQISNGSEFTAIDASFRTWQNIQTANIAFNYRGLTPVRTAGKDGMNLVSFEDDSMPLGSSTIAATFFFFGREVDGSAVIEEADIIFNTAFTFSTSGENDKFDIQGILTHEVGHLLGLDHSGLVSSVMGPFSNPSQTDQRTLSYDDIAGVSEIYHQPVFSPVGQIRGNVRLNGSIIFGAHVVAVDAGGTPLVSTISQPDGSYNLRFMPAGAYRVYAEPLDFPVSEEHVGGGPSAWYHNLRTDFGTTYFGNVATLTEAGAVNVTAGTITNADIALLPRPVTNLNLTRPGFASRIPRGSQGTLQIGGEDIRDGLAITVSNPGLILGAPTFGGRLSSSAPTSASFSLNVAAETPIGPKNIGVNRSGSASIASGAIVVTEVPPADLRITPDSGSAEGGMPVTVTGINFRPDAKVFFGGLPARDVRVIDSGTILANIPDNLPGAVNVQVFNSDGTAGIIRNGFTYLAPAPTITSVSPLSGPPMTPVTIEGTRFDPGTQNIEVRFNGVPARIVSATTTSIQTVVPFGAVSGPVTVSVFGQTAIGPDFDITESPSSMNLAQSSYHFIDASPAGGGSNLSYAGVSSCGVDDGVAFTSLPFDFSLFRDIYLSGSRISVSTNGWMSLETTFLTEFQNASLPAQSVTRPGGSIGSVPASLIAPFWDDLCLRSTQSTISTLTTGTAPNRRFVIQWSNMNVIDEEGRDLGSSLTFEVILYEGSNDIQFVYQSAGGPRSDGSSATIGAQDLKRTTAVQTGFNQPVIGPMRFITYRFRNGSYSVDPAFQSHTQILASGPQSSSEFTGIALLAPVEMQVVLRAFEPNGALATGNGIQNPVHLNMMAGQQYARMLNELFGFQAFDGWIEIEASMPGLGVYTASGSWDVTSLDGTTAGELLTDFMLLHSGASAVFVNPSTRAATVTMGTATFSIPARNRMVMTVPSATRVQSTEGLAVVERISAAGKVAVSVPTANARAATSLVFPHAVTGAGYTSTLRLANVDDSYRRVRISFGGASTEMALNPHEIMHLSIGEMFGFDGSTMRTGAVRVAQVPTAFGPGPPSLIGVLDIENEAALVVMGTRPAANQSAFAHVAHGNGLFTGLAIAAGEQAANVVIEVYDRAGAPPKTAALTVAANQQVAKVLSEFVASISTQLGGYILIRSDQPVWTWEIYGSDAVMASAPPIGN